MFGPCFVMQSTKCIVKFCNHLTEEERAGYFNSIVFLMPCGCLYSTPLPHGAVGWSAG